MVHLESSTLLQNKILSSLVKSNTPFLSVQAASLSSVQHNTLPSSVSVVTSSFNGVSNNVNQSSGSGEGSLIRWIDNPSFPRAVPLFRYISSTTKEDEIAPNGLVKGHLLQNKEVILPLIGIVVLEWSDWLPAMSFTPLIPLWVWILDSR